MSILVNWLDFLNFRKNKSPRYKREIDIPTYAIGDIHGRFDLLKDLVEIIIEDAKDLEIRPRIIFLGDYIDRGAWSKETIEYLIYLKKNYVQMGFSEAVFLLGNHEQVFLQFLNNVDDGQKWGDFGGFATAASYGIEAPFPQKDADKWEKFRENFVKELPKTHRAFLGSLIPYRIFGSYLFVHAGVYPKIPIEEQTETDLLWIRDKFLHFKWPSKYIVVHGHSKSLEVEIHPWRIGIDTGAYATGNLTALKLYKGNYITLHTNNS